MKLISAAFVALMFVACKPTEKNYKAAYDAAQIKREQAAAEQMRPASGLLSDDGPSLRVVDGDTIFVTRDRLRLPDGQRPAGEWGVAVALFKMSTNAVATASDLHEAGFPEATYLKGAGGKHYAVAGVTSTLDSARNIAADFRRAFPEYPYIGLPGAPVIIRY
ncbi:MAG: hypothetical protein K2G67_07530 [Muribaculaceae bacterium]|nr:hypothetical protein [Muribaculaceae bacterium]